MFLLTFRWGFLQWLWANPETVFSLSGVKSLSTSGGRRQDTACSDNRAVADASCRNSNSGNGCWFVSAGSREASLTRVFWCVTTWRSSCFRSRTLKRCQIPHIITRVSVDNKGMLVFPGLLAEQLPVVYFPLLLASPLNVNKLVLVWCLIKCAVLKELSGFSAPLDS